MTCWSRLGAVEVADLAAHLPSVAWPPVKGGQPNRVRTPPAALPVVEAILGRFFGPETTFDRHRACLSRLVPGATYEMHRDPQRREWLTRVHVPVVTNHGAWMLFEEEGVRVHFEVGVAYSFNTLAAHCYGNDGDADRVHLLFDVMVG